MSVNKVIYFKMEVDGIETAIRGSSELKKELKGIKDEMKEAKGDELLELERKALKVQAALKDVEAEQRSVVRALQAAKSGEESYDRLSYSLGELREAYRKLSREEREGDVGKVLRENIEILDKELKEIDASIGNFQRNVGNYKSAFDGFKGAVPIVGEVSGIMDDLSMATGGVGKAVVIALALFKGFQEAAKYVGEVVEKVEKLRGQIGLLTEETGSGLDEMTAKTQALADTFGDDSKDIVVAVNAVSKAFGVDYLDALEMVEKGYKSGANANGEFLDMLREYPTQFKAGGASADEFFAVIAEGAKQGVYSDKMVDSVKEFGLRIREQTEPTREALLGAFGVEFTEELLSNVNSGKTSSMEALRIVSEEMDKTKLTAKQTQTVIADVFGGAGEDAGLDFITSLKDVKGNMDELIDAENEYVLKAENKLRINEEIARAEVELSNAYKDNVEDLGEMGSELKKVGIDILTELAPAIDLLTWALKGVWWVIKQGIEIVTAPFKLIKEGLTWVGEALGFIDEESADIGKKMNENLKIKDEDKKEGKGVDIKKMKADAEEAKKIRDKELSDVRKMNQDRFNAEKMSREALVELTEKYKGIERDLVSEGLDKSIELMKEGRDKELEIEKRRYEESVNKLKNRGVLFLEEAQKQADKIALAVGANNREVLKLREKGEFELAEKRAMIAGRASDEYLEFMGKAREHELNIVRDSNLLIEKEIEVHNKNVSGIDKNWNVERLKKLKEDLDKRYQLFEEGLNKEDLLERRRVAKSVMDNLESLKGLDELSKKYKVFEFEVKFNKENYDYEKSRLEKELKEANDIFGFKLISNQSEDELKKELKRIEELKTALLELEADRTKVKADEAEKRMSIEREEAERTLGYVSEVLGMISDVSDAVRDNDLNNVDKRKEAEEKKLESLEKSFKGANDKEKKEIEKKIEFQKSKLQELDGERERIEEEAAMRARFIRIAQLISTTALAVMSEYARTGLGGAIVAGASGAIQLGVMLAQPFAEGGLVSGEKVGSGLGNFVDIGEMDNGDNVLATLRKGEVVLNEEQQRRLGGDEVFRKLGVRGFSGGGRVGDDGVMGGSVSRIGGEVAGLFMLEKSMENDGDKNKDIRSLLVEFKSGMLDMIGEINDRIDRVEVVMVTEDLVEELRDREDSIKEVTFKSSRG